MKYDKIVQGRFLSRPNRFIAYVEIGGAVEVVHVKNTGRCRELLWGNPVVYLSVSDNPQRKTKYDLVAVEKITEGGARLINMDSQIVNDVAGEYLSQRFHGAKIKREVTYKNSRFDFSISRSAGFCKRSKRLV